MKFIILTLVSLMSVSAFSIEPADKYITGFLDEIVVESQFGTPDVETAVDMKILDLLGSPSIRCSGDQIMDSVEYMPLNHHGPNVMEVQYAVKVILEQKCFPGEGDEI